MNSKTTLFVLGASLAGLVAYSRTKNKRPIARIPDESNTKVVILGAGFGGLTAAKTLGKEAPSNVDVLLIDRNNYHLFTPLLYQAAACGIDPWHIAYPARRVAGHNGFRFRAGEVKNIDFKNHKVILENGTEHYDYLIIALGSITNFFGQQSAEANSLTLKTLEDSVDIRNRVIDAFEKAAVEEDPNERKKQLCFAIVGGGATGVEFATALKDLIFEVLAPEYPSVNLDEVRIALIEAKGNLLGHIGEPLSGEALRALEDNGIEVRLNSTVKQVENEKIELADGTIIPTGMVVWTAGVKAAPTVGQLDLEKGKAGTIAVNEFLQVQNRPEVFAIGDNAWFVDAKSGDPVPMLASVAWQEGEVAAKNIVSIIQGTSLKRFHYRHIADMVSFGRNSAAAEFGRLTVSGFPGWLLWRLVHISLLTGYRDKLGVALDWTFAYFYERDTSRMAVHPEHPEYPAAGRGQEQRAA